MADKAGRPTLYKQEYCEQIIKYFDVEPVSIERKKTYYSDGTLKTDDVVVLPALFPTFQGFANEIGVNVDTLHEWKEKHEEFSEAYTHAKELQEKIWLVNGMGGLYNAQFAQFFGKNCLGYKDKQEVEHGGGVTVTYEDLLKKCRGSEM